MRHPMSALKRRIPAPIAVLLVVLGVGAGVVLARNATSTAIRNQLGAVKNPLGAKGRTLGLSRVVIPPGTVIPSHFHDGTQVAYIQSGVLTYSVETGSVTVMKGLADQNPTVVRKIKAGQTAIVRPGQWFIEQPSEHHHATNAGSEKIVVLQATLLKNGAPAATPVSRRRR
jgi:quercetin dioxygenase-like cupin family protein